MAARFDRAEKLLDQIYDAASDNDLWSAVLTEIADLTRSQGGMLFGQSLGAQKVYFDFNGRLSEECNRVYQERHMRNDWSMRMEHRPVGQLVFSDDILDLASLQKTAFFDEVLRPQDLAHNAMMALAAKDDFRAAFNICRSPKVGAFGAEEREILEWLQPHLRRSVSLGFQFETYQALSKVGFNVVDRMSDGVIVFDRSGRIVYSNPAADAFGGIGGVLDFSRRRTLTVRAKGHDRIFSDLLQAVLSGKPAAAMSIPHSSEGGSLTLVLSSVRGRDLARFSDQRVKDAVAVLLIIDPLKRISVPAGRLREAYGLTGMEAKVALEIASGKTLPDIAKQLDLSRNTVKSHLLKTFGKIGVSRQTELAVLIASIGVLGSMTARLALWHAGRDALREQLRPARWAKGNAGPSLGTSSRRIAG